MSGYLHELSTGVARDLLADELPRRWLHVQGVADRASILSAILDMEEVHILTSAAILHDIGYSSSVIDTGLHALDGARFLRAMNFPPRLCALVAHHSFAKCEAELRGLNVSLAEWNDEKTIIRDALWWADMTTTPDGRPTNVYDRIAEIQRRYGPNDLVTTFVQQAKHELVAAVERTEERLRAAGLGHLAK
ncbi:HD domain-containing protein [Saccharothrix texasensis]|uniref:HD domain-containing protein n=1 Tax=Saccharothrix texasensis TaxID=103734 RepID=UPI000F4B0A99|nr:HD domain-containing protein [Saccharothrix texasensis]